ncbi:hypothetical protein VTO42DRAFT_8510 [Malbranchea cinnamomea]
MSSLTLRRANWASELLFSSRTYSHARSGRVAASHCLSSSRSPANQRCSSRKHTQQIRTFVNSYNTRQNETNNSKPSTSAPTTTQKPATTEFSSSSTSSTPLPIQDITQTGLGDKPASDLDIPASSLSPTEGNGYVDWTRSYHGLSAQPFSPEAAAILTQPVDPEDVEIKPDGIVYLPEIKYRRILNRAFGPGGWGLVPRSESIVTAKAVTREYALVAHGRLVSIARGEQDYFSPEGIPTATEGCKSNAMMRCCKDLGVASELWDPRWIRKFKAEHCREVFVEHVVSKRRSKIWIRKGDEVQYPWKLTGTK